MIRSLRQNFWQSAPLAPLRTWMGRLGRARRRHSAPQIVTEPLAGNRADRYLDPAALVRLGFNPLIARRVVEGFLNGLHRSPFHGFSVEFADHREYVAGDDLKFLDWFVYARTDHYYIKRYEEETNLRTYILLDRSASMAFGTEGMTKWDYACFLATCLSYLMIKQQDAVGLALVGDGPGLLVPPRSRLSHLNQLMRVMVQNPPGGRTNLAASLMAILRNLKRRSLIVLISDLIDDPEPTLKAMRMLRSHRHDVIVFHVQDPAELELPFDGTLLFQDVETGEEVEVEPEAIRAGYVEKMNELLERYRKRLTEAGMDYQLISTRQPFDHALSAYLSRRAKLRK